MLGAALVLGVELQLLDHAGVLDEPQQDLLRQVTRPEGLHLWTIDMTHTRTRTQKHTPSQGNDYSLLVRKAIMIFYGESNPAGAF